MPDPRSNLFSVIPCNTPLGGAGIASTTSAARNARDAIGKFGDLNILNKVGLGGAGSLGVGLRTLASISNTIRTGSGALPTSIGGAADSAANAGTNWVLENVGISPQTVDAVQQFNPGIANQAVGQAQQIYQKVKQGKFKFTDIPNVLQDLQNLERLGRGIFSPSSWYERNKNKEVCTASPYATDLVARAPKYKFLYIVEFKFNTGYEDLGKLFFPFVVKTSTRPNVRFEMEDVNYYNFRTKVITKTMFDEMTMTFHDDIKNELMTFMTAYLRASSPITNKSPSTVLINPEQDGMTFTNVLTGAFNPGGGNSDSSGSGTPSSGVPNVFINTSNYSASRGPFANFNIQPIQYINLHHVYDYGRKVNTYSFLNPRITSLQLDDVDMSVGNEGNQGTIVFNYDTVIVAVNVDFNAINPQDKTQGGIYPLRFADAGTTGTPLSVNTPVSPTSVASTGVTPANTINTSSPSLGILVPPGIIGATTPIISSGFSG